MSEPDGWMVTRDNWGIKRRHKHVGDGVYVPDAMAVDWSTMPTPEQGLTAAQLAGLTVVTKDEMLVHLMAGRIYSTGGRLALSSGQVGNFILANPTVDRLLLLLGYQVVADQSARVRYRDDPTRSGGTAITAMPNLQGGPASAMTAHVGVGIVTAGAYLPMEGRTSAQSVAYGWNTPIAMPPGHSFALEVTAPSGLGATMDVAGTGVYLELPLG